jgi:hypothetical protein
MSVFAINKHTHYQLVTVKNIRTCLVFHLLPLNYVQRWCQA